MLKIGIGKFPFVNSQELQIRKFLTSPGRGGDGIGTGNKINSNSLQRVSVSVNFRLINN